MAHKTVASAEHEALALDIKLAMTKHQHLPPIEMLGVMAVILGQLIAVQDQTRFSRAGIMDMVARNIQEGNEAVIATLQNIRGNA